MKIKQFAVPEKRVAMCSTAALTLMAVGLTVLSAVTGCRPLLLLGLMLWLPAAVQLSLWLPLWESKPVPTQKQKLPARLWSKAKFHAPRLRRLIICFTTAAALVVTHLLFWKNGASRASGYYLPVVLAALFIGAMILEKWCRLAMTGTESAYTVAQLRSLKSALALNRVAFLLTAVTLTVQLLGFYDATPVLNVLLGILFVYESLFIAFSLAVRVIRQELDTAPEFLIAMPGAGKSNMGVLSYLEENTGITMRALWSMKLIKKLVPAALIGVAALLWLSTGVVQIEAHQQGALYRFGKLHKSTLKPGIHLTLPWPMDQVDVYDTESLGRLVIGYIPTGEQDNIWTKAHGGEEYRLLLGGGDELISVNLEIEYKISDLYSYVRNAAGPEALLQAEAYEIITERTISSDLETMLSTNREEFSESFRVELEEHMAHHNTGLEVVNVVLESIHPPVEVADVYQALIGASIDAQQLIIQAQNEANQTVMNAKNEQTAKVGDAIVQGYQAVAEAEASVAEFMASVAAFENYPAAYRYYKYMNTLTAAYGQARLIIVGAGVDAGKLFIGSLDKVETEEDFLETYEEEHAFDEEY